MRRLVVQALPSIFISMLMIPSVLSGILAVENKKDYHARKPDTKNNTEEDYKHDVAGIRRAVPQLPANISPNPNQACYTQFFARGMPPTGLRNVNLHNMRYICQQAPAHPGKFFYATMFDEGRGIPVYSAYVLDASNVNFQAQAPAGWLPTKGILHQATDAIYAGQPCQKGHLFPAMTASGLPQNAQNPLNAANSARSTYQYTNAVPQCAAFDANQWRVWEGRIRQYSVQCTAPPLNGVMYLITGVSFVGITNTNSTQPIAVPITTMPPAQPAPKPPNRPNLPNSANPPSPPNPPVNPAVNPAAIDKPNSMWTAGTCVPLNGTIKSFAVIGNNVQVPAGMLTQQISQSQLRALIQFDVAANDLKRGTVRERVNLFPGIGNSEDVRLSETEYPPLERRR